MSAQKVKSWFAITANGTGKDNKIEDALAAAGWTDGNNESWEAFGFTVDENNQPPPPYNNSSLVGDPFVYVAGTDEAVETAGKME